MTLATVLTSPALEVSTGLELLDATDTLIGDYSDVLDPRRSTISRNNLAKIHGRARLRLTDDLSLHVNRLRPYMTLTDQDGNSATTYLGVWIAETPDRTTGRTPTTFTVDCYDKLVILDTPKGSSHRVPASSAVVSTVEALITTATGSSDYVIDQTSAASTTASEMIWPLDESTTYLRIINDLLATIGYRGLYVDRAGFYRSEKWESPSTRPITWSYDVTDPDTIIDDEIPVEFDWFAVPNKWVFVRDDPTSSVSLPAEGAGIYTVTNQSDGLTSIDSRGRTITKVVRLDVLDHAALVTAGDQIVESDTHPAVDLELKSLPNPTHWHADVVTVNAPTAGFSSSRFIEYGWSLPLGSPMMRHDLRKV